MGILSRFSPFWAPEPKEQGWGVDSSSQAPSQTLGLLPQGSQERGKPGLRPCPASGCFLSDLFCPQPGPLSQAEPQQHLGPSGPSGRQWRRVSQACSDRHLLPSLETSRAATVRGQSKSSHPAESEAPFCLGSGHLSTARREQEATQAKDPFCTFNPHTAWSDRWLESHCAKKPWYRQV